MSKTIVNGYETMARVRQPSKTWCTFFSIKCQTILNLTRNDIMRDKYYLSSSLIGQNRIFHWPWHRWYVPNQSLMIVSWKNADHLCTNQNCWNSAKLFIEHTSSAYMTRRMRCPSYTIHTCPMIVKSSNWITRHPNIHNHYLKLITAIKHGNTKKNLHWNFSGHCEILQK